MVTEIGKQPYATAQSEKSRCMSPVLDLYFFRQITPRQAFTANMVGTYIESKDSHYDNEGTPYIYNVDGKTSSLIGEAIYENRLKPFTWSVGMNGSWKYTSNLYTGDADSKNNIHSSTLYLFSQLAGRWQRFTYLAGLGVSNQHYRQGTSDYDHWLWRPKASLAYAPIDGMSIRYDFELSQRVSLYAMISDTRIRQNSREWKVGNPDLRPYGRYTHQLTLSYEQPRWGNSISSEYRVNRHCNMELYSRTAENQFLLTQTNQRSNDMWYVQDYAHVDIIPDHLMWSVNGGIYPFFSKGEAYSHFYTAYNWGSAVQGYWGKWSFAVQVDNGWRFLEGERRGHNHAAVYGSVGYRLGGWSLSLFFQNPFRKHPTMNSSEVLNDLVHKTISNTNSDMGNVLRLSLSWRFSKGHQLKTSHRTMQHEDKTTGIM